MNQHHTPDTRHAKRSKGPRALKPLRSHRQAKPRPAISRKTLRRMAEMDTVLGIAKGQGVADLILGNLIRDIIHETAVGQTHGILENWLWEDRLEAEAALKRLAQRWAREDGKGEEGDRRMNPAATARPPRAGGAQPPFRRFHHHRPPCRLSLHLSAMKPDPDPHVHFVEELAELMLRYLMAVNAAARARRLAGMGPVRRHTSTAAQSPPKHWKRKGKAHRRTSGKTGAATAGKGWRGSAAGSGRTKRSTPPFHSL